MPALPPVRRRGIIAALTVAAVASASLLSFTPAFAAGDADCSAGSIVDVVAHPDDDLLFQNPDVLHAIDAGKCVTTVYVTSGDNGKGTDYWTGRETGVEAAYAQMAGIASPSWSTETATVAGKTVHKSRLAPDKKLSLVFLRLPDGGYPTSGTNNLKGLDQGAIQTLKTVDSDTTYTKTQLIAVLRELLTDFQPDTVLTQDTTTPYGDGLSDHTDHHAVAYFARTASNQYRTAHTLVSYWDYETQSMAANVKDDGVAGTTDLTDKSAAFYAYTPHDTLICQTAQGCAGSSEAAWLQRQYVSDTVQGGPVTPTTNLALAAVATASSQNLDDEQPASAVNDGSTLGYTDTGAALDGVHEWVSNDTKKGVGATVTLTWPYPVTTDRVTLFDRPNPNDRITSGSLTFLNGTDTVGEPVDVDALTDTGNVGTDVSFSTRTITSVTLTVRTVSATTGAAGLAEFRVWPAAAPVVTPPPTTEPPVTAPPTTTPPTTEPPTTPPPTTEPPVTTPPVTTPPTTEPPVTTPPVTTPPVTTPPVTTPPVTTPPTQPVPPVTLPGEKGKPKESIKDTSLTTKQFLTKGASATFTGLTPGRTYRLSYGAGEHSAFIGKPVKASSKGVITGTWKPNTKAAPALARPGRFQLRLTGLQTSVTLAKSFTVKYDSHLSWRSAHRSGKKVAFSLKATHATTSKDVAWSKVTVSIQKRVGHSWKTVAHVKATSKGVVTKTVKTGRTKWRVISTATGSIWGATSRTITR